jgi:hypothetical protein
MSRTQRLLGVAALATLMLAAACGGGSSEDPAQASEIGLLATAVGQLESTPADAQQCEDLMAALSRDLASGAIADDATLTSRREESTSCFGTVRTQIQSAAVPLREILELNGVSEETTFTPEQVSDMAGPVAAAYTLITIGKGLDDQIGVATALVDGALLGVPLGAGPLYGVTNRDEPVETVNALLFLSNLRELFTDTIGNARQLVEDAPNGG